MSYDPYSYQYDPFRAAENLQLKQELSDTKKRLANAQPASQIRIGRSDRDKYIEHLSNMYAEDRLTKDEFEERKNKAMEARIPSDLSVLVNDLPPLPLPKTEKPKPPASLMAPGQRPPTPADYTPEWWENWVFGGGIALIIALAIWGIVAMCLMIF